MKKVNAPHSPLFLVVNGAEALLQVALGRRDEFLGGIEVPVRGEGVQLLPLLVRELLDLQRVGLEEVSIIGCVNGPGSFTGIRITLSFCSALAMAQKKRVFEINYLPLLAQNIPFPLKGEVWVVTYARINTVYIQGFDGMSRRAITPPNTVLLKDLAGFLGEGAERKRYFLGSGVRRYGEFFKKGIPGDILPPEFDSPSLRTLFSSLVGESSNAHKPPLSPLYLRPSDAEENLPSILKKRGLTPP